MSLAWAPPSAWSYQATVPTRFGYLFLILLCFPGLGELPGGISLALLAMLAFMPSWLNAACSRHRLVFDGIGRAGAAAILACMGFLIFWSIVSVLNAAEPFRAGRYIASQLAAFAIFAMVAGTVTEARLRTYLTVACVTLAFTCLVSFFGYYEPHLRAIIFMDSDRASGFFKNPNQFGMVLSTLFPVATAFLLVDRRKRPLWLVCWLLLLLGLVACGSKTNLLISSLNLVLMLCAYSFVAYTGAKRVLMIALSIVATLLLVLGGALLLSLFNPRALRIMLTFLSQDGEVASLVSRDQLWKYSFQQFLLDPVTGQGAGQPINIFFREESVPHSHNVLLDYLRTLGAPGFLMMLTVLGTAACLSVMTLARAVRATGAARGHRVLCIGLAVGVLSYIAANMSSDSMGPSTSPFFWLLLFLGLAARGLLARHPRAGPAIGNRLREG